MKIFRYGIRERLLYEFTTKTKFTNFARPSPAVQTDPVTREGLVLG
jgi:hypothetical protein